MGVFPPEKRALQWAKDKRCWWRDPSFTYSHCEGSRALWAAELQCQGHPWYLPHPDFGSPFAALAVEAGPAAGTTAPCAGAREPKIGAALIPLASRAAGTMAKALGTNSTWAAGRAQGHSAFLLPHWAPLLPHPFPLLLSSALKSLRQLLGTAEGPSPGVGQ